MTDPADFDARLAGITARITAEPLDPELVAMFEHAHATVNHLFPDEFTPGTPEQREEFKESLVHRLKALPVVFSTASSPTRALQSLVTCLYCGERLRRAQILTREEANRVQAQVLGAYLTYSPWPEPETVQ